MIIARLIGKYGRSLRQGLHENTIITDVKRTENGAIRITSKDSDQREYTIELGEFELHHIMCAVVDRVDFANRLPAAILSAMLGVYRQEGQE